MRVKLTMSVCLLSVCAAEIAWAQPANPRLAAARKECWEAVGIYGDPYRTNGAIRFSDQVSTCVRAKMAGGGEGGRRAPPR